MRTLVIGDIHGGLKALEQVLERCKAKEEDLLVFLGDYVDGWSDAAATVNFLIALRTTHNLVLLRGNHDQLCYEWLKYGKDNPLWLQHGGKATMASYDIMDTERRKAHELFYESLDNHFLDEDKRLFLHAGFTNLNGIEFEYFDTTFYWDRTLWEMALSLDPGLSPTEITYPNRLALYHEIYIGHTPVTRIGKTMPVQAANVWNMDTGAGFKGPLSVMDVRSKEVWQSEPVYSLYPREEGRN